MTILVTLFSVIRYIIPKNLLNCFIYNTGLLINISVTFHPTKPKSNEQSQKVTSLQKYIKTMTYCPVSLKAIFVPRGKIRLGNAWGLKYFGDSRRGTKTSLKRFVFCVLNTKCPGNPPGLSGLTHFNKGRIYAISAGTWMMVSHFSGSSLFQAPST